MLKVLVVTLFSGENEIDQCCKSVMDQNGLDITHKVIKNMPKQEAHQKLYQLFNDAGKEFDYLAKLDGDMAFSGSNALASVIGKFRDGLDVVSATVHDGITDSDIQSFNVFSSRCYFHFETNHPLFTDRLQIDYPGRHYSYVDNDRNVLHAFNPSPFQAFMFGVHRALKVVQPGSNKPSLNNSYHQRVILNKVYNNYRKTGSAHARHALWGATLVFNGVIDSPAFFQKTDYVDVFENAVANGGVNIDQRLSESGLLSLWKVLGWRRFLSSASSQVLQKMRR